MPGSPPSLPYRSNPSRPLHTHEQPYFLILSRALHLSEILPLSSQMKAYHISLLFRTDLFPEVIDRFARRTVLKLPVERVAQLLVKFRGLIVPCGEARVATAPLPRLALRFLHQPSAKSMLAYLLVYPDDADLKPLWNAMRSPDQPPSDSAPRIQRVDMQREWFVLLDDMCSCMCQVISYQLIRDIVFSLLVYPVIEDKSLRVLFLAHRILLYSITALSSASAYPLMY